jgi:hypothetical protein
LAGRTTDGIGSPAAPYSSARWISPGHGLLSALVIITTHSREPSAGPPTDRSLTLDGVFSEGDDGRVTVHEAAHLTEGGVLRFERMLQRRVLRLFQSRVAVAGAPPAEPRRPVSADELPRTGPPGRAARSRTAARQPDAPDGDLARRWGRSALEQSRRRRGVDPAPRTPACQRRRHLSKSMLPRDILGAPSPRFLPASPLPAS